MHAVEILMAVIAAVVVVGIYYLQVGVAFAFLMAIVQSYQESKAGWPRHRSLRTEIGHLIADLFRWTFMWPAYIWAMIKR
jgi:hypothetical protein